MDDGATMAVNHSAECALRPARDGLLMGSFMALHDTGMPFFLVAVVRGCVGPQILLYAMLAAQLASMRVMLGRDIGGVDRGAGGVDDFVFIGDARSMIPVRMVVLV